MVQNSQGNLYFEWHVVSRLPMTLFCLGLFSLILVWIGAFFIEDPKSIKPLWKDYYRAYKNNNKEQLTELRNDENVFNSSMNLSLLIECKKNNEESSEHDDNIKLDIEAIKKSKLFLCYILINSIRYASSYFIIENFQYICMVYIGSDRSSSLFFGLSGLTALLSKTFSPMLFNKFGFYLSNIIVLTLLLSNSICLLLFTKTYPNILLFSILFLRYIINYSYIIGYIMMFKFFPPKVSLQLSLYHDSAFFIGSFLGISISRFFSIEKSLNLFYVYIAIEVTAICVFSKFYKNFKRDLYNLKSIK